MIGRGIGVSIFRLFEPAPVDLDDLVEQMADAGFTYPDVGATSGKPPAGWDHDEVRGTVGHGEADARRAEAAVRRWVMFDLGWVRPHKTDVAQEAGRLMAFTARAYGLWTVNVCRIVRRIESDDGIVRRVGFAYGTLPGHVLSGEEQFLLEWDRTTDDVTFAVRKFSRPNHVIARLAGPIVRRLQGRFSADAVERVARAAAEGT